MNKIEEDKLLDDYRKTLEAEKKITIGEQIYNFRVFDLKVSLSKLAKLIGSHRSTVGRWEKGESIPTLRYVSELVKLGLDADTLSLTAWL